MAMRRPRIKAAPNLSVMRARGSTSTTANVPPKTGLLPTRSLPPKSTPVLAPKSTVTSVLAPKSTVTSVLAPKPAANQVLAPKSTVTPVIAPIPTVTSVLAPKPALPIKPTTPVLETKSTSDMPTTPTTKPVLESSLIVTDTEKATITKTINAGATVDAIDSKDPTATKAASKEPIADANHSNKQPLTASKISDIQEASKEPVKSVTVGKDHSEASIETSVASDKILSANEAASKESLAAAKEPPVPSKEALAVDALKEAIVASNEPVAASKEPLNASMEPVMPSKEPLNASMEPSAASDESLTASTQVSKLSTGQFVNGRYLATEKPDPKPKVNLLYVYFRL